MGMSKKVKVMKVGDDEQHDKVVYLWFKQKQMEGVPISGLILCEKAVQLHKKMYGEESSFSGSTGWQWRFCKRHGIRNLSLEGEKLSANTEASGTFITPFNELVEEYQLTLNQIFNCDETESQSMPVQMVQAPSSYRSRLSKKQNAQGVLEVLGWNPTCGVLRAEKCMDEFRDFSCLVSQLIHPYSTQRAIFSCLGAKAVLVLDNCPAHPNEEDLISDDGNITALYLPLNVTSVIQPMDQGLLVALKCWYKKILLRRLLIEDENGISLIDLLKSVNMKIVIELIAESWGEIKESTLRKSWRKIMPIKESKESEDHTEGQEDGDEDEQEFIHEFQELGYSIDENEISTWLNSDSNNPGFQLMTDDEICEHVLSEQVSDQEDEPEPEEVESNVCPVSNSMAAHMFEKCLGCSQR